MVNSIFVRRAPSGTLIAATRWEAPPYRALSVKLKFGKVEQAEKWRVVRNL
jgi:hypothetical protein